MKVVDTLKYHGVRFPVCAVQHLSGLCIAVVFNTPGRCTVAMWIFLSRHHVHRSLARITISWETVPPRLFMKGTAVVSSKERCFAKVFTARVAASSSRQLITLSIIYRIVLEVLVFHSIGSSAPTCWLVPFADGNRTGVLLEGTIHSIHLLVVRTLMLGLFPVLLVSARICLILIEGSPIFIAKGSSDRPNCLRWVQYWFAGNLRHSI